MRVPAFTALDLSAPTRRNRHARGNWILQVLSLLLLVMGALSPALRAAEARELARVVEFQGKVEISRAGSGAWDPAYTNQVLQAGDRYRTGDRSSLLLRMSDRSSLRVGERSNCLLQAPVEEDEESTIVTFFRGVGYFFGRDRPDSTRIKSTAASAAIRGTEFVVVADEDGTLAVTLIDGEVELSNEQGTIALTSGFVGIAEPGFVPTRTAVVRLAADIQWLLYYPAVLDPADLGFDDEQRLALKQSLSAYVAGDLVRALNDYPADRQPVNDAGRAYLAMLLLSAGSVDEAEGVLQIATGESSPMRAVRELIKVVRGESVSLIPQPATASEWLVRSIQEQQRFELNAARASAAKAVEISPQFGFGWARLAELEFSLGQLDTSESAVDTAIRLAPRNAQAWVVRGFIMSLQSRLKDAEAAFSQAIDLDDRLGNAWLGRGLVRIRTGERQLGMADIQTAAVMEPDRSEFRSYLGKSYSFAGDEALALEELKLAEKLDPGDPTPWLYAALVRWRLNQINDAVRDLERSAELNDNRRVYRSRLLLDQDQSVRSANLAGIYLDAGMPEVSAREASRAVNFDYANYSAHLLLADSYNALRDPRQVDLRYETPAFTEYLLANLMAPASVVTMSPYLSSTFFTSMFVENGVGLRSQTEYLSGGDWIQNASQYGSFDRFGYSLDVSYRSQNGQRANNDLEQTTLSFTGKLDVTDDDRLLLLISRYDYESGDVAAYYDPDDAQPTLRVQEVQEPLIAAGWHHRWSPEQSTMALFNYTYDTLSVTDSAQPILLLGENALQQVSLVPVPDLPTAPLDYESSFRLFGGELQHLWQNERNTLIAGGRYQSGTFDTTSSLGASTTTQLGQGNPPTTVPGVYSSPTLVQTEQTTMDRYGAYLYYHLDLWEPLQLIGGVAYEFVEYPLNHRNSPLASGEISANQWSPKAGFIYEPIEGTVFRGAYSQFLGGVSLDQSIRIEPVQVAGFNQAFRSLIPESVVGAAAAPSFELFGLAWDQRFPKTGTYVGVWAELLRSSVQRDLGNFSLLTTFPFPITPDTIPQDLDFEERNLGIALNQLVGRDWVFNVGYRISDASLNTQFPTIPSTVSPASETDQSAILQEVNLGAVFNHPSGFFSSAEAFWLSQSNSGYSPDLPGDSFWQVNLFAGYRFFKRRTEVSVGVVNLTDQDYRLNPLNLHTELRRERTFVAGLKFQF